MRWSWPSRRLLNDSRFFCQVRLSSTRTGSHDDITEINNLAKVWHRLPPRPAFMMPSSERSFFISRNDVDPLSKSRFSTKSPSLNPIYTDNDKKETFPQLDFMKWLWRVKYYYMGAQLPQVDDLVAGCRQVFLTTIQAIIKRDLASLNHSTLGGENTMGAIKTSLNRVNNAGIARLKVSSKDFLGKDGLFLNRSGYNINNGKITRFIHNITVTRKSAAGAPLDAPYCVYTVYVAALLNKNMVYKMVQPLPFSDNTERAVSFMPKSYGYKTPKYVIMKLSLCQRVLKFGLLYNPTELSTDTLIYDFEIISF